MTAAEGLITYDHVSQYVSRRTGLALPANRRLFIEAGIARAASAAGVATLNHYFDLLTKSNDVLDDLIAELTVGETYFFRDPDHFEFIRREVIPDLRQRRGPEHSLHAWSAGCASGEEAYSLAILLQEDRVSHSHILATDISRKALARARAGVYVEWSLRRPRPGLIEHYFRRQNGRFILADRIRRNVTFQPLNLAADDYLGDLLGAVSMDLILCRNVLIYIEPDRLPAVAKRLFAALVEGGWLITGPADPMLLGYAPFDVAWTAAGIFYRRAAPSIFSAAMPAIGEETMRHAAPAEKATGVQLVSPSLPSVDPGQLAYEAFARGDYAQVADLLHARRDDSQSSELLVQSLGNLGLAAEAECVAAAAASSDPLKPECHLLHAITLLSLRRYEDAVTAARRVIYLRSDLPLAYLVLGAALHQCGAIADAKRAFSTSDRLASARPAHQVVLSPADDCAPRAAVLAAAQFSSLENNREGSL